ncbi:MAG: hypothetical protein ACI83D_000177 [Planctomycetota bacterium]|jgi:hypothetical protein
MQTLLEIIAKAAKTIRLSTYEKRRLRAHIIHHIREQHHISKKELLASPYAPKQTILMRFASHVVLILLIISVATTTSVMAAADSSLPGDSLYEVKVNITEEIRSFILPGPVQKIEYEITRAENRLNDAATLALQGELDTEAQEMITRLLADHTQTITTRANSLKEDDSNAKRDIHAKLESSLKAHGAILSAISQENPEASLSPIVALAQEKAQESDNAQEDVTAKQATTAHTTPTSEALEAFARLDEQFTTLTKLVDQLGYTEATVPLTISAEIIEESVGVPEDSAPTTEKEDLTQDTQPTSIEEETNQNEEAKETEQTEIETTKDSKITEEVILLDPVDSKEETPTPKDSDDTYIEDAPIDIPVPDITREEDLEVVNPDLDQSPIDTQETPKEESADLETKPSPHKESALAENTDNTPQSQIESSLNEKLRITLFELYETLTNSHTQVSNIMETEVFAEALPLIYDVREEIESGIDLATLVIELPKFLAKIKEKRGASESRRTETIPPEPPTDIPTEPQEEIETLDIDSEITPEPEEPQNISETETIPTLESEDTPQPETTDIETEQENTETTEQEPSETISDALEEYEDTQKTADETPTNKY